MWLINFSLQAYKTLEKKIGVEATMPGLGLTNDQTFFLAYGQVGIQIIRTNFYNPKPESLYLASLKH